jgi:hypothetical protein
MKNISRIQTAGALAIALAACGSDSTGPGKSGNSYIRADLSGALDGRFDASGSFTRPSSKGGLAMAAVQAEPDATLLTVTGIESATNQETSREIGFVLVNPRVGTYTLDDCVSVDSGCLGLSLASRDGYFVATSGTLTITSLTKTRIAGTFDATGHEIRDESRTVQIRNGTLDVEIIDIRDLGAGWTQVAAAPHGAGELR